MNDATVSNEILDALHDLTHAYRAQMRAAMQALEPGLTVNEMRMLLFIGRHPHSTHKDLVEHTHADKAQIARTLKELEERGWIGRAPHPEDKRSRVLDLSQRGRQLVARLGRKRSAVGDQMISGCKPEEQRKTLLALQRMLSNLQQPETRLVD